MRNYKIFGPIMNRSWIKVGSRPFDHKARQEQINVHCKCFVCWNRRRMSANQVHKQLAVIFTDLICNQIILFPCYFYRHLFVVLGVLCITFHNFVKKISCFYTFLPLISAAIYFIFQNVGSSNIYRKIMAFNLTMT